MARRTWLLKPWLLMLGAAVVLGIGTCVWQNHLSDVQVMQLRGQLWGAEDHTPGCAEKTPLTPAPPRLSSTHLPKSLQRRLRAIGWGEQRASRLLDIRQTGQINLQAEQARWLPFEARQVMAAHDVGFVWDARVRLLPGVWVRVVDASVQGRGHLRAALWGAITVAEPSPRPALDEGELMRGLAEALLWAPEWVVDSPAIRWSALDEQAAQVQLTTPCHRIALRVDMNPSTGLIERISSPARMRQVGDAMVPTPWEGRAWGYTRIEGLLRPVDSEVAWILGDQRQPYWRGHITTLTLHR